MPASRQHVSRIALLFLILFLIASCGSMKKQELTAGQAQETNVTVPDTTSVQIDTSSPSPDKAQQKLSQTH